jgi:hypothetical protein
MTQPAAPANTIVTTFFLSCVASIEAAHSFFHIRSAILKTSQPSAAKPTHQKSMTETTVFSFRFFTGRLRRYQRLQQVTNC